MGWGNCGKDSQGRPIGYCHAAKCDHPGCKKHIDRGLSYACGGEHGETDSSCEKYFCEEHRTVRIDPATIQPKSYCMSCAEALDKETDQDDLDEQCSANWKKLMERKE